MEHGHNVLASGGAVVTLTSAFIAVISHPIPLLSNILALVSITVGVCTLINIVRNWRRKK